MTQRTGSGAGNMGKNHGLGQKKVIDFNEVREQKLAEKRRRTERIFFRSLISVYSLISNSKMQPVELIEVSEDGCSFQVPYDITNPEPWSLEDIPIRLYFSQDTYLEIVVKILNSRPVHENDTRYVRYGCSVDKELTSYPAYQQFVKFLKLYAEYAHQDTGNLPVSIF
jgi:hypothetical protein